MSAYDRGLNVFAVSAYSHLSCLYHCIKTWDHWSLEHSDTFYHMMNITWAKDCSGKCTVKKMGRIGGLTTYYLHPKYLHIIPGRDWHIHLMCTSSPNMGFIPKKKKFRLYCILNRWLMVNPLYLYRLSNGH